MDEKIIDEYAFEIFSRTRIFEIKFKIFDAEQKLKIFEEKGPMPLLVQMGLEDTDYKIGLLSIEAQINGYKDDLKKLELKLKNFRDSLKD